MTSTDFLTAAAVRSARPFSRNGRQVVPQGDGSVRVDLHGVPLLTVSADGASIDIDGDALPTKKSSRACNAILSGLTGCRVAALRGQWFLTTPEGEKMPFTGKIATVPIN